MTPRKAVAAAIAMVVAFAAIIAVALNWPEGEPDKPTTMRVTSDVEGYLGYEVGQMWFDEDYPGMNSRTYADLDGDGEVSGDEKKKAEEAEKTTDNFVTDLLPDGGETTAATLMTPGGHDWWLFATSNLDDLMLWSLDAPKDVHWYANTWIEPKKRKGSEIGAYPAIHVAFKNETSLHEWVSNQDLASAGAVAHVRDNVVTIYKALIEPVDEGYPSELGDVANRTVDVAHWNIDFGKQVVYDATNNKWESNYILFWAQLGFTMDTKWSGVSQTPALWAGKITGWNKDVVDVEAAAVYINNAHSMYEDIPDDEQSPGLAFLSGELFAATGKDDVQLGNELLKPRSAPDDTDLILSTGEMFRGVVVREGGYMGSVTGNMARWIKGDTMVIENWLGTPPEVPAGDINDRELE